jgi:hypothetical protein
MDTAEWVQGVVAEDERQSTLELTGIPEILKPKLPIEEPVGRSSKRPRTSRSSSFLEAAIPAPAGHTRDDGRRKRSASVPVLPAGSSTGTSSSCTTSISDESHGSSDRYRRKPRRKTHQDRYDFGLEKKSRRKKHRTHDVKTSKKHHRTGEKKEKRKRGTEAGQRFHASNVARERLTVKMTTIAHVERLLMASSFLRAVVWVFLQTRRRLFLVAKTVS